MRLLLDTQIFIWLIDGNPNLSQTAKQAIEDESNTLHLSIVSLWEITIKTSLGKSNLQSHSNKFSSILSFPAVLKFSPFICRTY
ncbi:MAG: type II toxin-antitoxin system VapC family toxin [Limnospira sp.]